jgi:hypothetical protein
MKIATVRPPPAAFRAGNRSPRRVAAAICAMALGSSLPGAVSGCIIVHPVDPPAPGSAPAASPSPVAKAAPPRPSPVVAAAAAAEPSAPEPPSLFHLKPDWDGNCTRRETVDVNLGHAPEAFVRAAYCQITGQQAPAKTVETWSERLRSDTHVRRVDVVRSLALEAKRAGPLKLAYSDPWASQPDLGDAPVRKSKRDVGAVFMYFFNCPGQTNCGMDWANTHSPGMDSKSPLLGFASGESGYYSPSEPGFWKRELLDAKYAGLQFLLLNTYGPDIENNKLAPLVKALSSLDQPVQIGLFDDTWAWGEPYFGDFWKQKPNLRDSDAAAKILYEAKWKPFFQAIDKKYWYRFQGRPFIYFYNSGTLEPRERSAVVLAKMKARFKADFGEEPFVDVDVAYFADSDMNSVADAKFTWMTHSLPEKRSRSKMNGHIIDHAMVKWDAVGRDRPGEIAATKDRLIKDSALLKRVMAESSDADVLVLATWNDLGEGTGINRNYDYYSGGRWLEPDHFMRVIRASQSAGH